MDSVAGNSLLLNRRSRLGSWSQVGKRQGNVRTVDNSIRACGYGSRGIRFQPMRAEWIILFCGSLLASSGLAQIKDDHVGYIYCASDESRHLTPVYLDPCGKSQTGNLSCGQKLEVVSQSGSWLKVVTPDGVTRFVIGHSVSQKPSELVPVSVEAGPSPECKSAEPRDPTKNRPPRPVFHPDANYPESSRRSGVEGSVGIRLVVGVDGLPHDLKVVSSVDKDLDAKALETVQQWRFEPALKDGRPVEWPLAVSIHFHLTR